MIELLGPGFFHNIVFFFIKPYNKSILSHLHNTNATVSAIVLELHYYIKTTIIKSTFEQCQNQSAEGTV